MRAIGKSDIGLVRKANEDGFLCEQKDGISLFIVADGMGGCNAGEIASSMAINLIREYIWNCNIKEITANDQINEVIKSAIQYANQKVYKKSILDSKCIGMGTTLTMAILYSNKIYIGHVGDSRLYIIRENNIKKLTKDHSLVEELIQCGTIKPEEAFNHPQKNIITRALGTEYVLEIDGYEYEINCGDYILLCTDGLSNCVSEDNIVNIINDGNKNIELICDELIEISKQNGGYDNITAIIVFIDGGGE